MFKKKKDDGVIRMDMSKRHVDNRIHHEYVEPTFGGEGGVAPGEGLVCRTGEAQRKDPSLSSTMTERHVEIPKDFVDPGMDKVKKMMAKQKNLKKASTATKFASGNLSEVEREEARKRAARQEGPIGDEGFVKK